MSEINVKITELNNAISQLQSLQSKCNSINSIPPTTVGGGNVVNELEAISKTYSNININLGDLILNTVSFLRNVRDSYVSSDTKAASNISSK